MIKAAILVAGVVLFLGCSEKPAQLVVSPTPKPQPAHNYAMKDGMQYGYTRALSDVERQAGQVGNQLVMAYYAGERGGKYQAHIMDGVTVQAIECEKPCEYAKIMTYIDNPLLKDQIKVERMKAAPGTIAWLIMDDAMNGRLRVYGRDVNGKPHSAWVDGSRGMQYTPVVNSTASASNPVK